MATSEIIEQSTGEISDLLRNIDDVVDEYIANSSLPKEQAIVNVGRALNAYFVSWIANLGAELETRNIAFLGSSGLKSVPNFKEPTKEFKL